MEAMVFGIYFTICLLCGISSFVISKRIKDARKKTKINSIIGIVNTLALLMAVNILFYLWKTPLAVRLFASLVVIAFAFFGSKNVRYCQQCRAMNQWVMFRKYCSKCGSLIESDTK